MDTPIIIRIKRLLALSQSPNVHEAASAAAEAQRLMLEYQIESACLEDRPAEVVRESVAPDTGKKKACMWRAMLAYMLGKHMCVSVVYIPGTDRIDAIGRGPDVAALCVLYHHVAMQLERACEGAWLATPSVLRKHLTAHEGGKVRFTDTFQRGARDEISKRMAEMRKTVATQIDARSAVGVMLRGEAPATTAMVRLDTYAREAREAIVAYQAQIGFRTTIRQRHSTMQGHGAYDAGRTAGRGASLTHNSRALPGR